MLIPRSRWSIAHIPVIDHVAFLTLLWLYMIILLYYYMIFCIPLLFSPLFTFFCFFLSDANLTTFVIPLGYIHRGWHATWMYARRCRNECPCSYPNCDNPRSSRKLCNMTTPRHNGRITSVMDGSDASAMLLLVSSCNQDFRVSSR